MSTKMSAAEFGKSPDQYIEAVAASGEPLVLSNPGKPGVAIVPLHVLEGHQRARQRLADTMAAIAERSGLSPEEGDRVALEEVAEARAARRGSQGREAG